VATIYPKRIPLEIERDPRRKSERILFDSFREFLGDEVIVYYSRTWRTFNLDKNKESVFVNGEADFIIVWPDYGILVIECKGGGVEFKDGIYTTTNKNFEKIKIKNPYKQVDRSRYRIIEHILHKNLLGRTKFELTQSIIDGVFFPQSKRSSWGQFDIDQKYKQTGFEDNLKNIASWVKSLFITNLSDKGLRSFSKKDLELIHQIFEPEGSCEFAFNTELIESENFFAKGISPSLHQAKIISQLKYTPRNLICGSAGTGKTLIGIDALHRFSDLEKESLYVCNSQILAQTLRDKNQGISKNIEFYSFLEFLNKLIDILNKYEVSIDPKANAYHLIELITKKTPYRCKTLVIDEMQDFDENIIPALARLTTKNGNFICLFDPQQNISNEAFSVDDLRSMYSFGNFQVLEDNVRNTPQIISFYQNVCPSIKAVNCLSPNGPEIEVISLEKLNIKKLDNCINKLLKKFGLRSEELLILVKDHKEISDLRLSSVNINSLFSKLSFNFDCLNKIRVLNVEAAKGLESKAVLIWSNYKEFTETEKYIAMSRARSLLAFVELASE
tara:strand:+ start:541 stop:2214 length:1674 start_codon:yes stop_codon:yes gene_type:complete